MSIGGPSGLGTLLVQRLDAALGITLSQQSNIVSGARPDAVTQADSPHRADAVQNPTSRDAREAVDKARVQAQQQGRQPVDKGRLDPRAGELPTARSTASTAATSSAPTTLGQAAQIILALLAKYPELSTAVQGKTTLLSTGLAPNSASTQASAPASVPTPGTGASGPGMASANIQTPLASGSASAAPPLAALFSHALSHTLQTSGMFYESHLNNLVLGKQSIDQLLLEPQAHAGRQAGPAASDLDPQVQVLVRQQLEVLANQSFAWRGDAWQDAPMQWEVSRQPSSADGDQASADPDHWATRLTINLPGLGEVQARLTLAGQQIVMQLVAPESVALLNGHANELRGRFSSQGLHLSQLSIVHDAPHEKPTTST